VTGIGQVTVLERDDGQRGRVPVEYLHKETVLFNRPPLTNIRSSKKCNNIKYQYMAVYESGLGVHPKNVRKYLKVQNYY
jgi:hypothetical protein